MVENKDCLNTIWKLTFWQTWEEGGEGGGGGGLEDREKLSLIVSKTTVEAGVS